MFLLIEDGGRSIIKTTCVQSELGTLCWWLPDCCCSPQSQTATWTCNASRQSFKFSVCSHHFYNKMNTPDIKWVMWRHISFEYGRLFKGTWLALLFLIRCFLPLNGCTLLQVLVENHQMFQKLIFTPKTLKSSLHKDYFALFLFIYWWIL